MALSERLRSLRKERGLSQETVARRADIGLKAYGELERGIATDPHFSTLAGIARALGLTVAELVAEESETLTPEKVSAPPETGQPPLEVLEQLLAWALEAQRLDEERQTRAVNRLIASEGRLEWTHVAGFAEDAVRNELRSLALSDPDGYFEFVTWPLVTAVNRQEKQLTEQERELSRLRKLESRVEAAREQ